MHWRHSAVGVSLVPLSDVPNVALPVLGLPVGTTPRAALLDDRVSWRSATSSLVAEGVILVVVIVSAYGCVVPYRAHLYMFCSFGLLVGQVGVLSWCVVAIAFAIPWAVDVHLLRLVTLIVPSASALCNASMGYLVPAWWHDHMVRLYHILLLHASLPL